MHCRRNANQCTCTCYRKLIVTKEWNKGVLFDVRSKWTSFLEGVKLWRHVEGHCILFVSMLTYCAACVGVAKVSLYPLWNCRKVFGLKGGRPCVDQTAAPNKKENRQSNGINAINGLWFSAVIYGCYTPSRMWLPVFWRGNLISNRRCLSITRLLLKNIHELFISMRWKL